MAVADFLVETCWPHDGADLPCKIGNFGPHPTGVLENLTVAPFQLARAFCSLARDPPGVEEANPDLFMVLQRHGLKEIRRRPARTVFPLPWVLPEED